MKVINFLNKNIVLVIAAILAIITSIIVLPDAEYLNYIDFKTLTCLFITLLVICALRNIKFFRITADKIISLTKNLRLLAISLVYITFIGSMLIANDMALITFLPLGYYSLKETDNKKYMAYIFILQNISANLGGMLTPFGNPQNLYLYSYFNIPTGEFMSIMFPSFVLAIAMLTGACFLLKPIPLTLVKCYNTKLPIKKTIAYLAAFSFTLLIVFRVFPYWIGLIIVPIVIFFMDKSSYKYVDYGLLATFFFFFIFAGNMSRIEPIRELFEFLLSKSTLLFSELSCQIISNVPSAVLLSRFTNNYKELLLGVNIGGTGTIISSLASLITFSEYRRSYPGHNKEYLKLFIIMNTVFLVIQTLFAYFLII